MAKAAGCSFAAFNSEISERGSEMHIVVETLAIHLGQRIPPHAGEILLGVIANCLNRARVEADQQGSSPIRGTPSLRATVASSSSKVARGRARRIATSRYAAS